MKELKVLHPMTGGDDGEGGVVSLVAGDGRPTRLAQFGSGLLRELRSYPLLYFKQYVLALIHQIPNEPLLTPSGEIDLHWGDRVTGRPAVGSPSWSLN